MKSIAIAGAVAALAAVIFGAFGAHALKSVLEPAQLAAYHTAVTYQMYHGLACLIVAALGQRVSSRLASISGLCFLAGIVLFSGSIYLLTLADMRVMGPVTPIGGLFFMIGWAVLIAAICKGDWRE